MSKTPLCGQEHRPFQMRKYIVVASLLSAITTGVMSDSFLTGFILYSIMALGLDVLIQKVLKLKVSFSCDPILLKKNQNISPKDLDIYFESRLTIRALSVAFASIVTIVLSFFLSDISLVYGMSYVGFTLVSIFYVRLFTTLKRPVLVRFYPVEYSSMEFNKWQDNTSHNDQPVSYSYKDSAHDWITNPAFSNLPGNIFHSTSII